MGGGGGLITDSYGIEFKDVRANCLCASLLRTQFMSQRHLRHARARAQRKKSIHIKGWYPLC